MEWGLKIIFDRKVYRYRAELKPYSNSFEHIRIIARNKTLVFQSNRPLLKSKFLKHRPIDFILIQGTVNNQYFLELIMKSLEEKLRENKW
jgi:hypothetical protein